MKSKELLKLQNHNRQLYQLIASATQSYLLARALGDLNEDDYNLSLKYFLYHENLYIKNTVIELYKILKDNDNEKHNIYKYLRIIENNKRHFKNLKPETLDLWRSKLNGYSDKAEIIFGLRSKYYAHIDINHQNYLDLATKNLDFEDLENLFSDLQDFYIQSNFVLFGDEVGFEMAITLEYFRAVFSRHLKTKCK